MVSLEEHELYVPDRSSFTSELSCLGADFGQVMQPLLAIKGSGHMSFTWWLRALDEALCQMLNTNLAKSSINVSFNSSPHDSPQTFLKDPPVQTEPLFFSQFLYQVISMTKHNLETTLPLSISLETPGSPLYYQLGPALHSMPSRESACRRWSRMLCPGPTPSQRLSCKLIYLAPCKCTQQGERRRKQWNKGGSLFCQ